MAYTVHNYGLRQWLDCKQPRSSTLVRTVTIMVCDHSLHRPQSLIEKVTSTVRYYSWRPRLDPQSSMITDHPGRRAQYGSPTTPTTSTSSHGNHQDHGRRTCPIIAVADGDTMICQLNFHLCVSGKAKRNTRETINIPIVLKRIENALWLGTHPLLVAKSRYCAISSAYWPH